MMCPVADARVCGDRHLSRLGRYADAPSRWIMLVGSMGPYRSILLLESPFMFVRLGWSMLASFVLAGLLMTPPTVSYGEDETSVTDDGAGTQFYEVRTYVLGEDGDAEAVDAYLQDALIPALQRQGIGPVGAFAPSASDTNKLNSIFVVLPYDQLGQLETSRQALANDAAYQAAAAEYLGRSHDNPPYQRIHSELLSSIACWPKAKVPAGLLSNSDRVYELRLYESATERIADTKIEMFNSGEVPIFLDCDITPIFMGRCVAGAHMPSMTYLTSYENEAARLASWKAFVKHPDWKVLKVVPKYDGTVSRIDKFVLQPKPYSQM
ncbi:NIPSNAP protein [Neorhodopirellula lusitana]|uniref:NIPSNAP protein n=1 Tax=Neorhodopirellula lusitana TaxID=445327 RepID=A0ABY1QAY9_9BACT|nr:NIPSNAP family protein [Neorhodopirellula lusitana]SMP66015.1 NIPSNAP protein [Neorhodopirellula lusitana]